MMYELSGTEPIRESHATRREKSEALGMMLRMQFRFGIGTNMSAREIFGLGAPYDIVR